MAEVVVDVEEGTVMKETTLPGRTKMKMSGAVEAITITMILEVVEEEGGDEVVSEVDVAGVEIMMEEAVMMGVLVMVSFILFLHL